MLLLILGLALWVGVHFWKRIAPDHRASFGEKGKMIVAIGSALAIVLMPTGWAYYKMPQQIRMIPPLQWKPR